MKNKFLAPGVMAFALLFSAPGLRAVPITGNIAISGGVQLDTTDISTATKVIAWFNNVVDDRSGSFAGLALGAPASLTAPWTFYSGPTGGFWTVGGFTFNLSTSGIYAQDSFLNVLVAGTITGNGYDATPFLGTFQVANSSLDRDGHFTGRLAFGTYAPDGGTTLLLLGLTFIGMAIVKKKKSGARRQETE